MTTAYEIMQNVITKSKVHSIDPFEVFERMTKAAEVAINEARIEAIKECAGKAKIKEIGRKRTSVPTGSNFESVMAHIIVYDIDKQSILSLIDQVK